jgi:SAM-dependent methyltransferase
VIDDTAAETLRLCKTLLKSADFAGARMETDRAMAAWPREARFAWLSAQLYARETKATEAFADLQKAIDLDPANLTYWQTFCQTLLDHPHREDPALIDKIARAMGLDGIANASAFKAAQQCVDLALSPQGKTLTPASVSALRGECDATYRLLLAFLEYGRTTRFAVENALTQLRRGLLEGLQAPAAAGHMETDTNLLAALAIHCFNNEFVFAESDEERTAIAELQDRLRGKADVLPAIALGAYRPISDEPFARALLARLPEYGNSLIARALKVLVAEPLREQELKKSVVRVTPIDDRVSGEVRAQYEQNPYPRWRHLGDGLPASSQPPGQRRQRILIAGCGTGRQPLLLTRHSPQDEFWAMDLSLSSFAYGMRKAEELGIGNIRFVQGDILELDRLDMTFDAITCTGVLHHMAVPEQGLAALRGKLAGNGVLKIMVYTESGRQSVVAGIALREQHGLAGTPEGIRRFRDLVISLPADHPAAGLRDTLDFYSASECRDLVFHVMEHRYTLPMLAAMFTRLDLKLAKFIAPAGAVARFRKMFPDPSLDPRFHLDLWTQVEDRYPGLFGSMYRVNLMKA